MSLHGNMERVGEVPNTSCFVVRFIFVHTVRALMQTDRIKTMTLAELNIAELPRAQLCSFYYLQWPKRLEPIRAPWER